MSEVLVTSAWQRALLAQRPDPGLIVHSDRGGQYVANAYKALLREAQAQLSHSRRGECYDNALPGTTQAESPWSRLKTEVLELREWPVFADLADAKASIADYLIPTITTACTPVLATRRHIALNNSYLKPLP